jgi:glycosyltransferase involved in cell wall biosynthesis
VSIDKRQDVQPLISLCMIVKNESKHLARCLSSVASQVDEMIIVDTGSEDDTVEISKKFGAQTSYFEWCDDFSAARNYAISQSSGQWILVLDADEELIVQSIDWRSLIPNSRDTLAYSVDLKDAYAPRNLTAFYTHRLFRKDPELKYAGRYHEYLEYKNQPIAQTAISHLQELLILHYGYTAEILPQKSLQRIPILEKIQQEEGLDLMLLWSLLAMYGYTQNQDKIQECYEKAFEYLFPYLLSGTQPNNPRSVPSWMYSLGKRLLQAEDLETLRLLCQRGQEWYLAYPPLSYLTGLMIKSLGFPQGAIPYFESCIQAGQSKNYITEEPFDSNLITTCPALERNRPRFREL